MGLGNTSVQWLVLPDPTEEFGKRKGVVEAPVQKLPFGKVDTVFQPLSTGLKKYK